MGKLYCVMGPSASGKDTIYRMLCEDEALGLRKVVPYTTRPMRDGEVEGVTYHFVTEDEWEALSQAGKVIEGRVYHTVHGPWRYFTVDDGQIDLEKADSILIGTLEAFSSLKDYFGEEKVSPVYIQVEDDIRLYRALTRELSEAEPKYKEMCRRFIADLKDFSEEKIREAGIVKRFENMDVQACYREIRESILGAGK